MVSWNYYFQFVKSDMINKTETRKQLFHKIYAISEVDSWDRISASTMKTNPSDTAGNPTILPAHNHSKHVVLLVMRTCEQETRVKEFSYKTV